MSEWEPTGLMLNLKSFVSIRIFWEMTLENHFNGSWYWGLFLGSTSIKDAVIHSKLIRKEGWKTQNEAKTSAEKTLKSAFELLKNHFNAGSQGAPDD